MADTYPELRPSYLDPDEVAAPGAGAGPGARRGAPRDRLPDPARVGHRGVGDGSPRSAAPSSSWGEPGGPWSWTGASPRSPCPTVRSSRRAPFSWRPDPGRPRSWIPPARGVRSARPMASRCRSGSARPLRAWWWRRTRWTPSTAPQRPPTARPPRRGRSPRRCSARPAPVASPPSARRSCPPSPTLRTWSRSCSGEPPHICRRSWRPRSWAVACAPGPSRLTDAH